MKSLLRNNTMTPEQQQIAIFNSPNECETEKDLAAYFNQQAYRGDYLYDLRKEESIQTKHDNE